MRRKREMERLVFLDRDGVINKYPGDFEYVKSWEEFTFLTGIKPTLKKLNENNFKVFIISNQAGVSRGVYTQEALDLITAKMLQELEAFNIKIDGVYYCTHRQEDNCSCRKPKTGLVDKVIRGLRVDAGDIDFSKSYFIGDTIRDIQTGRAAGLKTILVFSGKEKPENRDSWQSIPDFQVKDLSEAVSKVIL